MAFVAFVVLCGGGYGLAHDALGLSPGWASLVGWLAGLGAAFIVFRVRRALLIRSYLATGDDRYLDKLLDD